MGGPWNHGIYFLLRSKPEQEQRFIESIQLLEAFGGRRQHDSRTFVHDTNTAKVWRQTRPSARAFVEQRGVSGHCETDCTARASLGEPVLPPRSRSDWQGGHDLHSTVHQHSSHTSVAGSNPVPAHPINEEIRAPQHHQGEGVPTESLDFRLESRNVLSSPTLMFDTEAPRVVDGVIYSEPSPVAQGADRHSTHDNENSINVRSLVESEVGLLPQFDLTLPVSDVLYTQHSISSRFRDGRVLQDLIAELVSWRTDPISEETLVLSAFVYYESDGQRKVHSLENRRLYCLKHHQRNVHPWRVMVRLRCTEITSGNAMLIRFIKRSGGANVRIR
jgi:hypothetical protein